ncbi:alpha/beta-hydrolase [Anaeromyces robustus]|uniref:Alpha/beta-hydrolase n=1 Tax=Anaeromyces robustus TaxID=1754192 RepID=A0A1Y1XB83_9FUNG|nr:alpha/beta-hydrolase [Anaeromyces robustus]|eukprot:ORX82975.1 alpha/beta-hydrolase [Anaeromyces robustus]
MMHPENVSESSNLLTHAIEQDYNESMEEDQIEEEDFDIQTMPTMKEKKRSKKTIICLGLLLVLILIGIGVAFIFFSPQKFRINENTEDNVKAAYSFDFKLNKPIDGTYNETLAVKCQNGIFVGNLEGNILSYKGIPYAKPPTGNLRWKPPVKPEDSLNTFEAYNFGYSPIQTQWDNEPASYYEQSEDCLTLNIWINTGEIISTSDSSSNNSDDNKSDLTSKDSDNKSDSSSTSSSSSTTSPSTTTSSSTSSSSSSSPTSTSESNSTTKNNKREVNTKKPVMVYIYGGSYGWGGTVDPMYNGSNFVKEHPDILLVTINYRLGIMGFIDFSKVKGGEDYKESGNLGLLDQIQALKWIKENIIGFGGDPDNITIFGDSAGASSVSILAVMPEAKGLFKRIIAQSGTISLTYSKKECEKLTKLLLQEANADTMDDLLTLTEDTLKEINIKLNDYNNFPERDGIILPENLYEVYQNGTSKDIDILIGTNKDESRYWLRAFGNEYLAQMAIPILYENDMKEVSDEDKESADKFVRLQEYSYPWSISEFYNELLFRIPAIEQAINHSKNGGNVYVYYWTYPVTSKELDTSHSVELAYIMDNLNQTKILSKNKNKNVINQELATSVQSMWVNFAKTGNPSVGNTTWDKFEPDLKQTMILGEKVEMKSNLLEEQYILIKPLLKYNFNGCYTDLNYNVNYVQKVIIGSICILLALIILPILLCKRKRI